MGSRAGVARFGGRMGNGSRHSAKLRTMRSDRGQEQHGSQPYLNNRFITQAPRPSVRMGPRRIFENYLPLASNNAPRASP